MFQSAGFAMMLAVVACGDDDVRDSSTDVPVDVRADAGTDAGTDAARDVGTDTCTLCGPEDDEASCADGFDNDEDGAVDCVDPDCLSSGACEPSTIRIIAGNLSSGGRQNWDGEHGLRILAGLRGDVFLVQEFDFGDNGGVAQMDFAARACGAGCEVFRGSGELIPNGIVSRFPILDAGVWDDPETDTREFAWARIDVPGTVDLWAVSVHFLTSSGADRERQADALLESLDFDVPTDDLLVVGGDFNIGSGPVFGRLSARVVIPTLPTDNLGNRNTNGPRSRVLDAVLVSQPLQEAETPVQIGDASFAGGLVVDTRVFTPIEDLAPALVNDSGAPDMQHMAIVRDFVVRGR